MEAISYRKPPTFKYFLNTDEYPEEESVMDNNIIKLSEYTNSSEEIRTFNQFELHSTDIAKEKITQRRIYSFLVDLSAIMVINTAIHTSYALFINEYYSILHPQVKTGLLTGNFGIQAGVFILAYMTYFFYSLYILNGKSLGKMVFKLQTIDDNFIFSHEEKSFSIGPRQAFRRTFGYLSCYLSFGTFFIFSLLSEDKRGLPDYFSSSRTVSLEWLESMKAYKQYEKDHVRIDISSLDKAA